MAEATTVNPVELNNESAEVDLPASVSNPEFILPTGRGLAYEGKGDVEKAKTDYRKALAVAPKYDDGQWAHETAGARLKALGAN